MKPKSNSIFSAILVLILVFIQTQSASAASGVVFNINPLSRFIGSFGGDINCQTSSSKTPVILIHGNADSSLGWTKSQNNEPSFVDSLKAAGYTNCDIYAISYLSLSEQLNPSGNYHELKKMKFLKDFIETVLKTTGQSRVDIVSHSLGVTLSLETLHRFNMFKHVRKFVGIAGAMHGLQSCKKTGPILIPTISTCAAIINKKNYEFGFWPDQVFKIANPKMGDSAAGLSSLPLENKSTLFYSISAGLSDEVICADEQLNSDSVCQMSSYFKETTSSENIMSQVLIGKAPNKFIAFATHPFGGDIADGVGHLRARDLSAPIVSEMLTTDCKGLLCCDKYQNSCATKPNMN